MAVDIRAELQETNDILLAMDSLAGQAIEFGMKYDNPPDWACVLKFLTERALNACGDAEMRIRALVEGA